MCASASVNRGVLNIGSGVETSINDLLDKMAVLTGKKVKTLYNPNKTGGVPRLVGDIGEAHRKLGFVPRVDLEKGLAMILRKDARFNGATLPISSSF